MLEWLNAFIEYNGKLNFWTIINSQFFSAVVIGAVGLAIQDRFRSDKVDEQASAAETKGAAAADDVKKSYVDEVQANSEQSGDGDDHRDLARAIVRRLKSSVDEVVAADGDGRHRRVYKRLGRMNYKALVQALYDRSQLPTSSYKSLMLGFSVWDDYAAGKAANKPVPEIVVRLLSNAEESLG